MAHHFNYFYITTEISTTQKVNTPTRLNSKKIPTPKAGLKSKQALVPSKSHEQESPFSKKTRFLRRRLYTGRDLS